MAGTPARARAGASRLLQLQRTAGNSAVAGLLAREPDATGPGRTSGSGGGGGAVDAAQQALMNADATFITILLRDVELGVDGDEGLTIDPSVAGLVIAKFETWHRLNLLQDFVALVRTQRVGGLLTGFLGTDNAWKFLVAVLGRPERTRLYDLLADGNLDARNAGRFSEDVAELWDVQMTGDAARVLGAYNALTSTEDDAASGVAHRASAGRRIVEILAEYRALDQRYGMKGTLLSRFLVRCDRTVEVDAFLGTGWITQQTRMLDDIERRLPPSLGNSYAELLDASHLELAKGAAPELLSVEGQALEAVAEAVGSVEDLVAYVAQHSEELATEVIRVLAKTPSKVDIVLAFVAAHFPLFPVLSGAALSFLSAKYVVKILEQIDPVRLGQFYLAMVTLAASAAFLPQLFAAYWLLPEKTRVKVFGAIGRTAFEPIIREAKAFVVPVLRDIVGSKMPVGTGFYFERGLSAGARVARAGGDSSFSLIRTDEDTFQYNERFALRGGVGAGAGVGTTEGKKPGDDGKQVFWAHELSANAAALAHGITQNQYEFPVFDDDAFVGFLAAFVDIEAGVSLGAYVFDELKEIDPLPYLTKAKLEHKIEGSAAATARTGLKQGQGEGDAGGDRTHTWQDGQRPDEMGASRWAMFGTEAGATIQQLMEVGASLEIERKGRAHQVALQLGAKQATTLSLHVPGIGLLARALPANVDSGAAVKIATTITGLAEQQPEMTGKWTLSLVGTTGELDTYEGSASETEVTLATDASFDSVESFIAALGDATFKRRLGIASGFGSKMLSAVDHQIGLTSQLKKRYGAAGIKLKGAIDLEFELSAADTRLVARTIHGLLASLASSDDVLGDLEEAVTTFLTRGTLAPSIAKAGATVGQVLARSLTQATYHVEVGGAQAFGVEVEKDVGAHGYVGAGAIFHGHLDDPLADLDASDVTKVVAGIEQAVGGLESVLEPA